MQHTYEYSRIYRYGTTESERDLEIYNPIRRPTARINIQSEALKMDHGYIDKIREAAQIAVDRDIGIHRPGELRKIPLNSSPLEPRSQSHSGRLPQKTISKFCIDNSPLQKKSKAQDRTQKTSRYRRRRRLNLEHKRKIEAQRVDRLRMMVLDAAQDEEDTNASPGATKGERKVMQAITRSHHALLTRYERTVEIQNALDQEHAHWRHQSPAERGVNTSPKNSWSTSRFYNPMSTKKHTKNPPAFHSDDIHLISLRNAHDASEKLGQIVDEVSSSKEQIGKSVVKKLGFNHI